MNAPHRQKKTDPPRAHGSIFPILVVIALILVISSFFVVQTPTYSQFVTVTPSPYTTLTPPPTRIVPTATPVITAVPPPPTLAPTGKKPPGCTFPLAQTTTQESAPESYTFSDPKPVPLDPAWSEITLYQWLPDNQRILIGHKENEDKDDPNRDSQPQIIGLDNPQTGESQDFGSRWEHNSAERPAWIPSLNAIVYPESVPLTPYTLRPDGQGWLPLDSADFQRRLWLSRGDPTLLQTIVDERVMVKYNSPSKFGEQITVAASPDGSEIVYLDTVGRQLYRQSLVQGAFQSVPSPAFDATRWTYRPPSDSSYQTGWYITWRPNSSQVFLYSNHDSFGFGYTFLLDVQSGAVCELNLWTDDPKDWRRSWAPLAHWSPNGRYLGVVRMKGPSGLTDDAFSDLIVLDSATGKLDQIDPTKFTPTGFGKSGKHFVIDVAWAPDNRHLATIAVWDGCLVSCTEKLHANRLFLLDFMTGESVQISSAELGHWDWPNDDLVWSNDGSQLVVIGPPNGLYLLSVQKRVQP